jgi:hypothetical protein
MTTNRTKTPRRWRIHRHALGGAAVLAVSAGLAAGGGDSTPTANDPQGAGGGQAPQAQQSAPAAPQPRA